jgi:hypothetical protein
VWYDCGKEDAHRWEGGIWSAASIAALAFWFRTSRRLQKENEKAAMLAALKNFLSSSYPCDPCNPW